MRKKYIYYSILFVFAFYNHLSSAQQNKIDSLKTALSTTRLDSNKVNCLISLAGCYKKINPDTSIIFYKEAIDLSEKIKWKKGSIKALLKAGAVYSKMDVLDSAKVFYSRAIIIAKKSHEDLLLAKVIMERGRIYYEMGDYTAAMEDYIETLNIFEKKKIKNHDLGLLYHNIGSVFKRQKNKIKARQYYEKEYELAEELKDEDLLAESLYLIGQCEEDRKKKTNLFFRSLKIYEAQNDKQMIRVLCSNLIDVYSAEEDYEKCVFYALKSLKIVKEENLGKPEMAGSLCNLAKAYNRQKKYAMALKYLNEVKEYLPHIQTKSDLAKKSYFREAYKTHQGLGDYKNALLNYEEYVKIRMALFEEEKIKSVAEIETKYDANKKSLQIEALEKDKIQKANIALLEKRKHQTTVWSITGGLILVLIFSGFVFRSLRITRRQKEIIEKQKEEVDKQREIADSRRVIAEEQREVIKHQKKLVEEHQKEIVDSITYAKRIQYSLLANKQLLEINLPEHFILFKPKDIVSGDFYWATKRNNKFYIAACDSTGHGVPGAFMSLLNISFLNEAVNEKNIEAPHEILNHVRKRLMENMDGGYDGMDAVLVCIENERITYAAANNPPTIVKNDQILVLPADKMPVGKGENKTSFTLYSLEYEKGDSLYLYTDGYADQFGGPNEKKFKYKQLDELLISISNLPATKQEKVLNQKFEDWRGALEQVDDVLIIGMKL